MVLIVLLIVYTLCGIGSVLYYLSVCITVDKLITKCDVYRMLCLFVSGISGTIMYFLIRNDNKDRVIWEKKK